MKEFTFVDLFCGAGGFTEGLLLAGDEHSTFKLLAASDHQENAELTYTNRFRNQLGINFSFLLKDVRNDNFSEELVENIIASGNEPSVDVVIGGPPCQGFSVFGLRKETDPRNDLFLSYLKVIQALRPKYFVMENVPGLVMMYGGKTVKRIHEEVYKMEPVHYGITDPIKLNAANFGVPQLRERIIFIGYREDVSPITSFELPIFWEANYLTVEEAIGDLAFLKPWQSSGEYNNEYPTRAEYQRDSRIGRLFKKLGIPSKNLVLQNHEAAKHSPDVIARFALIEPGKGLESIPREIWDKHLQTSKKWCVRLHPHKPSFTVVTLPDDFVHYSQPRILTVREMARLQSFDDTFVFMGARSSGGGGRGNKKRNAELPQYTQVGNAVPPLLAKAIGNELLKVLSSVKTPKFTSKGFARVCEFSKLRESKV